ncbi:hypothetical protein [Microcoleus sp. CAWBG640]|uniref:hypothetical protein n=1 Tax=Microcoleus sp. CAWBG640 TaxID=2841653 RepID=UPI00312B3563
MLLAFVNIRGVTTEIHTRSNFILLSFVVLSFAKIAVLTRGRSPIAHRVPCHIRAVYSIATCKNHCGKMVAINKKNL